LLQFSKKKFNSTKKVKKMLVFPNAKINLGLHVVNTRPDGYHSIETVFFPVNWQDALEIIENPGSTNPFIFSQSGLAISGEIKNNLIYKAWKLIAEQKKCPPLKVHLHKNIPMGAGLGGGSADAAFFINAMNELLQLGYNKEERTAIARQLGADCAFFIQNSPVFARGKGDELEDLPIDLSGHYILMVHPGIQSGTAEAYSSIVPKLPAIDLRQLMANTPLTAWKNHLVNDFEPGLFKKYPQIAELKQALYDAGALYASMSGSGSAVFGIFDKEPALSWPQGYSHCLQKPLSKIL
jgi:4-diphosphocytidyl-2-C-methyl-D-erythritol kinase